MWHMTVLNEEGGMLLTQVLQCVFAKILNQLFFNPIFLLIEWNQCLFNLFNLLSFHDRQWNEAYEKLYKELYFDIPGLWTMVQDYYIQKALIQTILAQEVRTIMNSHPTHTTHTDIIKQKHRDIK